MELYNKIFIWNNKVDYYVVVVVVVVAIIIVIIIMLLLLFLLLLLLLCSIGKAHWPACRYHRKNNQDEHFPQKQFGQLNLEISIAFLWYARHCDVQAELK